MDIEGKIVDFTFCNLCEHCDKAQDDFPCHECLNVPGNIDQRKPMYYKKDSNYNIAKRIDIFDEDRKKATMNLLTDEEKVKVNNLLKRIHLKSK